MTKYKSNENIVFLAFTRDSKDDLKNGFFPNYKLDFKIIPNSEKLILETFKMWWGYPCTILLDKHGKVYKVFVGGKQDVNLASKNIETVISNALKELIEEDKK